MAWLWRTNPRSIIKVIQWFKYFANLEGENWNEEAENTDCEGRKIHPVRRKYYYDAHNEETAFLQTMSYEDYLSGTFPVSEDTESNARNNLAGFKLYGFGYVDNEGIIRVTETGRLVADGKFDSEDLIKIMLKINFPSPASGGGRGIQSGHIFPLAIILKLIDKFDYINKYELGMSFFCEYNDDLDKLIDSVSEFRRKYNELENQTDSTRCKEIFIEALDKNFHNQLKDHNLDNIIGTYCGGYADALCRALIYTGLFNVTGRGNNTKIRIAEYSIDKVKLIRENYSFSCIETNNINEYMDWFGNNDNILLPWENKDKRKELTIKKIHLYKEKITKYNEQYNLNIKFDEDEELSKLSSITKNSDIKLFEKRITSKITELNELIFRKYLSKGEEARINIINKFEDISSGDEDMAALWLECNTWKSLIAINGEKNVKRNFSIEEDLSPKYFAPGKGNTPDMELYTDNYAIIPEVSLMTGVVQWEHEASSVIDHILNIKKKLASEKIDDVIGIFISSKINIRTLWQFFILNKESWLKEPVPVVPITIEQYVKLIKNIYSKDLKIDDFKALLDEIHNEALKCSNFENWDRKINECILEW